MSSKSPAKASRPDFSFERAFEGLVCGLDEVGRAPVAGPVVAACVYIPAEKLRRKIWREVNDSKTLPKQKREELSAVIKEHACWAIGEACHKEIASINIVQASFLAMRRAYETMCQKFNITMGLALIDGHLRPQFPCAVQAVVKGDSKSVSIAAASIIAKVYRDNLMASLAREYPHYGWEQNVGYPTRKHLEAIEQHGLTPYHRETFISVKNYKEFGTIDPQTRLAV